jgi:hypothetical protein
MVEELQFGLKRSDCSLTELLFWHLSGKIGKNHQKLSHDSQYLGRDSNPNTLGVTTSFGRCSGRSDELRFWSESRSGVLFSNVVACTDSQI